MLLFEEIPGSAHKMCELRILVTVAKLSSRKVASIYSLINDEIQWPFPTFWLTVSSYSLWVGCGDWSARTALEGSLAAPIDIQSVHALDRGIPLLGSTRKKQ